VIAPFQRPGLPASVGLTIADCEGAAWAIAPDGSRFRGAAAINATLGAALGVRLPLAMYRLPPIGRIEDRLYALVARHRHRLPGGTPHCARYPADCGLDAD